MAIVKTRGSVVVHSDFDGMSVKIFRETTGQSPNLVVGSFDVKVISAGEVVGSAKDYIMKDFFEDPDAIAIVNDINTCLGITDPADLYDGLEDWYTAP